MEIGNYYLTQPTVHSDVYRYVQSTIYFYTHPHGMYNILSIFSHLDEFDHARKIFLALSFR